MSERTEAAATWVATRRQYGDDAPETRRAAAHVDQVFTAHDFADAHGNDSSTWTSADFDTVTALADMDMHRLRKRNHQPPTRRPAPAA